MRTQTGIEPKSFEYLSKESNLDANHKYSQGLRQKPGRSGSPHEGQGL